MEVKLEPNLWEKIITNSLDIICTIDKEVRFVDINNACRDIIGYQREELVGQHLSYFIHPNDVIPTMKVAEDIISGLKVKNFENRYIHKQGYERYILWSAVWSKEDELMVCVGRDITEQKQARRKDELHQAIQEYGVDTLALFDENLNYLWSGGSTLRRLGYMPEQLIGMNAFSLIHPEDVPMIRESLSRVLVTEGHTTVSDFRFRNARGEWRWLETTVSNQLGNPAIRALIAVSHDITERVENRLKLRESEQRFKSLFDHHVDIVLFQNKDGVILDANSAALSFFDIPKEEIVHHHFTELLPLDIVPICAKGHEDALKGDRVRYEVAVPFDDKGVVLFDISKMPVYVNGNVVGVYSILRDVTEIHLSNKTIRRQAEKLNTIMESITDAFFTLDRGWNFTYVNAELERLFQIDRSELLGVHFWERNLGSNKQILYNILHNAVNTGKAAHFELFLEHYGIWLEVKAYPSEEGLSVYVDNVTEKVKSRQELEKLSLVASKTTNGVLITDSACLIEWVNEGFTNLTGYTLEEVRGKHPATVLQEENSSDTIRRLKEVGLQDKPFQEEVLNYKKSGEKVWFLLDTTPLLNDAGEAIRYFTIQTDITERKEAEAKQLQLTKDLFRQNNDLQQFTYIVSHNLRSPVANMMGLANVLSMVDKESANFDTTLGYLKKSANQLDTVLRDLNMILSVRDKRDAIDRESVQIAVVCKQALDDLNSSLNACGGEVSMDIDDSLCVNGNKAYLYSVFHNLLSNAIKYRSSRRALKISIRCVCDTESGKIISFSDNGSGFDMQLAGDKLFKLYKRFHAGYDGRGIGLFLIKTHLNAMDAHIEVTSRVNVGTKFLMYFK